MAGGVGGPNTVLPPQGHAHPAEGEYLQEAYHSPFCFSWENYCLFKIMG